MLRLLTFGGLALERLDGSTPPRLRPQRLAILAVLAAAGDRGLSRERLSGLFWSDTDEEHARHSLRQALYALRQEIGIDVIQPGAIQTLARNLVGSDVGDFRAALASRDRERAARLVGGPFLQGFYLPGAPAFEQWVEHERASLATEAARVVLALAKESESAGDHDAAAEWWRRLTILDPLSGRFALGYLKVLAARGDRAGALAFARSHEHVVRRELEADPDPEIRRLEAELRAIPSPVIARTAPVDPPVPTESEQDHGFPVSAGESRKLTNAATPVRWRLRTRRSIASVAAALVLVLVGGVFAASRLTARPSVTPTLAVGMIREEGVPDTLRIGGVLTDMLATNLARVSELSVLANSRLFELMLPGQDTLITGYTAAARRAGATEILQGRLLPGPQWSLALEIQRVDLATGLVKGGYRVAASDRYALIDSMTANIARDLRLFSPRSSVSEATTDSPLAYRLYEEGLRAYYQYDEGAARRLMDSALQEDSSFAMAAYYFALLTSGADSSSTRVRQRALRLAARAPDRERLLITADISVQLHDPVATAVAETLATRYPNDPRAREVHSNALFNAGDWRGAAAAIEGAIALDSASEIAGQQKCRLCDDLHYLSNVYHWWDSLPAAERTAERALRLHPKHHAPFDLLFRVAAARGDADATKAYFRQFHETNPHDTSPLHLPRYLTLAEEYEQAERDLQPFLDSPVSFEAADARWILGIALRNQGRLEEASRLARAGPSPDNLTKAILALEQGNARLAVSIFRSNAQVDQSVWAPGVRARHRAWTNALMGMALLAARDTLAVRQVADTVDFWGQRSHFGRDQRLSHYLRGMLLVAEHRDAEAVPELQRAMFSPAHGFTRINYELGKVLLRLGRGGEAVPVVRAALHGDIDGSNLYVTRTDLHELLAQAFDQLGTRDSAVVHYRAVVRAWRRADPHYHARRDAARSWLKAAGDAQLEGRDRSSRTF